MKAFRELFSGAKDYLISFIKWCFTGLLIGAAGGLLGALLRLCTDEAVALWRRHDWTLVLLPLGGLLIVFIYHFFREVLDTNSVIRAMHSWEGVSFWMVPLIFVGTVISHYFGAPAGRTGASLQIGGAVGYNCARLLRFDVDDRHVAVMCGVSAVLAANIDAPITSAFFALEVAAAGIVQYSALFPCVISSLVAVRLSRALGVGGSGLAISGVMELSVPVFAKVALLGVGCAVLSIIYCRALHNGERLARRWLKNPYLRVLAGGSFVVLLSLLTEGRYNGTGMAIIRDALAGQADWSDFIQKMCLTVVCIISGYKCGELFPATFVGATFGCVAGQLLGLDPGFAAALGLVGLSCAMVNCPIAAIMLGVELFGAEAFPFFVLVCTVSFMMSGNYSSYVEQVLVYSKIKARYINRHVQ